jgi:hypothetical protein
LAIIADKNHCDHQCKDWRNVCQQNEHGFEKRHLFISFLLYTYCISARVRGGYSPELRRSPPSPCPACRAFLHDDVALVALIAAIAKAVVALLVVVIRIPLHFDELERFSQIIQPNRVQLALDTYMGEFIAVIQVSPDEANLLDPTRRRDVVPNSKDHACAINDSEVWRIRQVNL